MTSEYKPPAMAKLHIICNGCGELMRQFGEWPVVYPKTNLDETKATYNTQQTFRYACEKCRLPHADYKAGVLMMISILDIPEQEDFLTKTP